MSKYTTEVRFICESEARFIKPNDVTADTPEARLWRAFEPYLMDYGWIDSETGQRYYILDKSVGADKVDAIINLSWNRIFNGSPPEGFFDDSHYPVLCKKILKHYYLREICCETVGIWKLWLQERMTEIMPYYNKLYESAQLQFDPLNDVDLTTEHDKQDIGSGAVHKHATNDIDTEEHNNGQVIDDGSTNKVATNNGTVRDTGSNTLSGSTNYSKDILDKYSDTPQGSVNTPIFDNYLTNARKINESGSTNDVDKTDTRDLTSTANNTLHDDTTIDNTRTIYNDGTGKSNGVLQDDTTSNDTNRQTFTETVKGKRGSVSFSKMLSEYRETILNIDQLVIREFRDLFFLLW